MELKVGDIIVRDNKKFAYTGYGEWEEIVDSTQVVNTDGDVVGVVNNQLKTTSYHEDGTPGQLITGTNYVSGKSGIDGSTEALETIDYAHHEIHAGSHYFFSDSNTLGDAVSESYLITTPDTTKWGHFLFNIDGAAITSVMFYEDSDRTGTALQTVFNNNRNSSNIAAITIHKGISGGTTDGVLLTSYASGTATNQSRSPAEIRSESEINLKQNTKYLIVILSGTAGNLTNIQMKWYEHTSKN